MLQEQVKEYKRLELFNLKSQRILLNDVEEKKYRLEHLTEEVKFRDLKLEKLEAEHEVVQDLNQRLVYKDEQHVFMKNGLEKVIEHLQKENWDLFKMTKNDLDPHKLTRNQEQSIESGG